MEVKTLSLAVMLESGARGGGGARVVELLCGFWRGEELELLGSKLRIWCLQV